MTSRNSWLDFLKFISIICVIIIHVGPFYQIDNLKPIGVIINNIMRFAVPCFFMCTGYFLNSSVDLFDEKDNQRIKRNVRKLFLIYILWCAIYILLMPKDHYFILNVMLFGTAPHLWFLSALIQCLLIKYFLNIFLNKCSVSKGIVFSISLLCFLVFYYYCKYYFNDAPYIKTIVCVFVFYIYGAITRTSVILSKERSLILIVIGLILQLAEAISAWKYLSMSPTIDFNFGTLLFSIGMFNLFLAINKKSPSVANLGKDSLGVYLIHYFIIICINDFIINHNMQNDILKILCVFGLSYAFTIIVKKISYLKILVGA